ncbi:pyridoxamine 5'-phosphate oxidase family protein [Sphingomicrobium marinum]|uniref:pyridoxamine 5'-phosphate oxidase family protein n=1 Tax=Sphingomicrobium marinum TaxID=1227950 RepID=UPI00223F8976|nr:pyridoxamine 5'-phosphate oxidase family protein [Sphingomicrobium marinum]
MSIELATYLLRDNRVMSVATMMDNGWPQCTMVAYANDGMTLYFVISKSGSKYENIQRDARIGIAIGHDVLSPRSIKGLSIAACASEVEDEAERSKALKLLMDRRPPLERLREPGKDRAAVMKAEPELMTVMDYSKGFGFSTLLSFGENGAIESVDEQPSDWGYGAEFRPIE